MKIFKKVLLAFLLAFVSMGVSFSLFMFLSDSYVKAVNLPRKFGATYMTMDNPYFNVLNSAIEEVIESNGDILITRDPSQNQQKQNEQIADMLESGVEFLFINPVDVDEIAPSLKLCAQKHVPFIVVDTDITDSSGAVSVIQSDNYDAGRQIGLDLCKKRTKADIVVLYDRGIASTSARFKGFLDVLYDSTVDYRIVYITSNTTLFQPSMTIMQQFLEKDIAFDVVFGGNDPACLGALAAVQKKHVPHPVLIYGVDGSPDGKSKIEQNLIEGTAAQYPKKMGKLACEMAYDYLSGREVQKSVTVPVTLITRENLSSFEVLGWQ